MKVKSIVPTKGKLPEPRFTLQDLLNPPKLILQADLYEYFKACETLKSARLEVETLGALIMGKLILSVPIQSGALKAQMIQERLHVAWARD
jgi:hypothetical protein